jgi:hypothetical protein
MKISKTDMRWILNCARTAIRDRYQPQDRRWKEMDELVDGLAEETGVFSDNDAGFDRKFVNVENVQNQCTRRK